MIKIKATNGNIYELQDSFCKAVDKWGIELYQMCNQSLSQQKPIIEELKIGTEKFVLRGSDGRIFLEYYKSSNTIYPQVFRIQYVHKPVIEVTEEDFQEWLRRKGYNA